MTEDEQRLKEAFLLMLDDGLDSLADLEECLHEDGFMSSDIREMFWALLHKGDIIWHDNRTIERSGRVSK